LDCQQASERLPWLLNGTLEPAEAEAVRAHVDRCGVCQEEMDETRQAAAVFGAHLPPAALTDLAWDRPAAGVDADVVKRHLDRCRDCSEELELARESRRLEAAPDAPRTRAAPGAARWWRAPALAAGLAAAFVAGLWSGRVGEGTGPARDPRTEVLAGRIAEQEREIRRLGEAAAGLEAQMTGLRAPQLNLPVFELLPAGLTRRSAQPAANEVVVPEGAAFVALLLNAEAAPEQPAAIEIRNAGGDIVWSGQGLRPSPLGGYTLAVPASLLPPGDYTLAVRAGTGPPQTYAVRVRRAG
jgi:hypothetical protein